MEPTLRIFDVQERATGEPKPPSFPTPLSSTASGFPAHKKRTSAFKQRRQGTGLSPSAAPAPTAAGGVGRDPPHSRPRDNPSAGAGAEADEKSRIDEENQARIAAMSPAEIMEAQNDLFSGLDPRLIQILLRRATLDEQSNESDIFNVPQAGEPKEEPPEIRVEDTSEAGARPSANPEAAGTEKIKAKKTVTFDEDAAPAAPPADLFPIDSPPRKVKPTELGEAHDQNTTHFPSAPPLPDLDPADPNFLDSLHKKYFPSLPADPSRLAWMAPLPTEDSPADRESPYYPGQSSLPVSALRFDFHGVLLPPSSSRQVPVTKGLHHHGEAPEAAGYTIPELARLARSAVPAQRCLAYQTLGRMLYRLGRGEWGTGSGGRGGDEDDLAFGLWRCVQETRVLDSLGEEAAQEDGKGHLSAKAFATEALWLFERGGWKERWRGL